MTGSGTVALANGQTEPERAADELFRTPRKFDDRRPGCVRVGVGDRSKMTIFPNSDVVNESLRQGSFQRDNRTLAKLAYHFSTALEKNDQDLRRFLFAGSGNRSILHRTRFLFFPQSGG